MARAPHADIARELAAQIAAGTWPVGALLPTEFELCERYAASRYTVRLALGQLQEQGLISRRKNVGTRVEAARPVGGFTQALASVEDLAQFGATHSRVVQEVREEVVDLATAALLGCAGGSRWLRISSLRMDGARPGRPIGWTDAWVDPAWTDLGERARAEPQTLLSALIEADHGVRIAAIHQDIRGATVPAERAAALQAEPGAAALLIVRRYVDDAGRVFQITTSLHPADRFVVSTEMRRARLTGEGP